MSSWKWSVALILLWTIAKQIQLHFNGVSFIKASLTQRKSLTKCTLLWLELAPTDIIGLQRSNSHICEYFRSVSEPICSSHLTVTQYWWWRAQLHVLCRVKIHLQGGQWPEKPQGDSWMRDSVIRCILPRHPNNIKTLWCRKTYCRLTQNWNQCHFNSLYLMATSTTTLPCGINELYGFNSPDSLAQWEKMCFYGRKWEKQ